MFETAIENPHCGASGVPFINKQTLLLSISQGNILKIKDFRNKISGQVIRLALMSSHYKQPLDWNDKLINDCQNTLDKWYRIYSSDIKSVQVSEEVLKPLYEDLNTPGYLANEFLFLYLLVLYR